MIAIRFGDVCRSLSKTPNAKARRNRNENCPILELSWNGRRTLEECTTWITALARLNALPARAGDQQWRAVRSEIGSNSSRVHLSEHFTETVGATARSQRIDSTCNQSRESLARRPTRSSNLLPVRVFTPGRSGSQRPLSTTTTRDLHSIWQGSRRESQSQREFP